MKRTRSGPVAWPLVVLLAVTVLPAHAQPPLEAMLTFELPPAGDWPAGWGGGPPGTALVDSTVVHGGRYAARLQRDASSPQEFTTLTSSLPVDFAADFVELRGWIRTADVTEFAGLWMREDGPSGVVAFDNMQSQKLAGTNDWAHFQIVLPLEGEAEDLWFGFLVAGTGTAWVDDLELTVDGVPVDQAPRRSREPTVLDTDQTFAAGSGVALQDLSATQAVNLATLGKVWGFLKYHHPAVTSGQHHFDHELFRVLPQVLAAADRPAANAAIDRWVAGLGEIPRCDPCASPPDSVHLAPDIAWLADAPRLGPDLSARLRGVYANRPAGDAQFYVRFMPHVGNAVFQHEPAYDDIALPDAGYQLLGVYRFWNAVAWWFPYRDQIDDDWDAVLREFAPRALAAADADAYALLMMELIARIRDSHANLWSHMDLQPPRGQAQLPVVVRFLDGEAVVAEVQPDWLGVKSGLLVGDVIVALDGRPVDRLVDEVRPYHGASNEAALLRNIARKLTRGDRGPCEVTVRRGGEIRTIGSERIPLDQLDRRAGSAHDRPGEICQRLDGNVGYLKLAGLERAMVASHLATLAGTRGLILDLRNYPTDFPLFELGGYLVQEPTPFVRFTRGTAANPGAFRWREEIAVSPGGGHYDGQIVILVDEVTQSSAEYHAMAFRAAPGAVVVGSTTAGADGNISRLPLPGGLHTLFSGIGVFYPDGTPTQRVGIVPDIEVRPTRAGLAAGRDEVLEAGLRVVVGES